MFKEDIFNNFVKLNRGFDLPDSMIEDGNFPVVASTTIKAYHKDFRIKGPGVVTGRSGSLGTVQYIDENYWPLNTALYVKDFKGNHPRFVCYFLKQMNLENFNSGAGVPSLNQNHLHKVKIKIPNFDLQKRVAAILSTFDDLIENYQCRILLLEKLAEELYREWFVRLRFPNYEDERFEKGLPTTWDIKPVKDIVDRKKFGRLYYENELSQDGNVIVIDQSRNDYLGFYDGEPQHKATSSDPIILFGDHSCKMVLMTKTFSLAENVIPFKPKQKISPYFLYHLVKDLTRTTEYKRHWTDLIVKKVLVPSEELQFAFEKIVKPNHEQIELLRRSISKIQKIRDALLPRLISGKLSVENLDIQFPPSMLEESVPLST